MKKKILVIVMVALCIAQFVTGCVNHHYVDKIISHLKEKQCALWYDSQKDDAYIYPYIGLENNGTLQLLDFNHGLYVSGNKGDSWTKLKAPWFDDLSSKINTDEHLSDAKMNSYGEWIIVMSSDDSNEDIYNNMIKINDNTSTTELQKVNDTIEINCNADRDYANNLQNIYYVDKNGKLKKLDYQMNENEMICDFNDDGRIIILNSYECVGKIYNLKTGELKEFNIQGVIDNAVIVDNKLYILNYSGIYGYNLNTYKEFEFGTAVDKIIAQIYDTTKYDDVKLLANNDELYILCDNGMYKFNPQNSTIKLLFNGKEMMCSKEDWCLNAYAIDSENFYFIYSGLADSNHSIQMIKVKK